MKRQRLAQLSVSPLHLQQGLFASLALLVTLIGGQQFSRWEQSQQQEAVRLPVYHTTQTHFSAVSTRFADSAPLHLMDVEQAQPATGTAYQERWVF
ncbi:hypothetical protein [Pseudomonas chlororaphis]|uniref:hypothetical protein n=1 Tax=Pseudomonas chlororaphis TaxID=587753 RepID=UPI000F56E101|nr:hypothetical protein [Pseudomonas chlororaphis]AZD76697.1 hypothetical protein C4K15_0092 [Pseudomonas chlororaphis subsp. aurantiaca]